MIHVLWKVSFTDIDDSLLILIYDLDIVNISFLGAIEIIKDDDDGAFEREEEGKPRIMIIYRPIHSDDVFMLIASWI